MSDSLTIICLHGVGLWPGLFAGLDLGARVVSPARSGYAGTPSVATLGGQVELLAGLVQSRAPAVVVGVSGGATLALACAVAGLDGLVGAVSHEPLIGRLEPEIDDRVRASADELEAQADGPGAEQAATTFLRGLYGTASWSAMPYEAHRWADDHTTAVCREVRHFSNYQPMAVTLRQLPVPHLTTVGSLSSPARHRVAAFLGAGGSTVAVVDGSGHHVLIDRPDSFASLVRSFVSTSFSELL